MRVLVEKLQAQWTRLQRLRQLADHADTLHEAFEERDHAPLSEPERQLLENVLTFADVSADDIGVPRAEIVGIKEGAGFNAVLQAFKESNHSRLPVYGRDLDDVKGLVTLKDFITWVGREESFSLAAALRPVTFVPETMPIPRVLQQMKRTRMPLVLVADEYGGTTGLVTLKDILEELVGDIEDEHAAGAAAIFAIGPGRWQALPLATLDEVQEATGIDLHEVADEDVLTVGGLVMKMARRVPAQQDRVRLSSDMTALVTGSDGRRLTGLELWVSNKETQG